MAPLDKIGSGYAERASTLLTDLAYQRPPRARGDPASVQGIGNLMQRSARTSHLADDGKHVGSVAPQWPHFDFAHEEIVWVGLER
jgi:hypothetical protein